MIKTLIALAATTASVAAPAAFAGTYVNVEANSGFTGTDYEGSVTDIHIGYEGGNETYGFYVQGGPAIIAPEGGDGETRLSGKIGGDISATEKLVFMVNFHYCHRKMTTFMEQKSELSTSSDLGY